MNRLSQAKNKRALGICAIFFGIMFTLFSVSIFSISSMDVEKKIIQDEINEEYGGNIQIEIGGNQLGSEDNMVISLVKYLFIGVGLIIGLTGVFWVVSSYKLERQERETTDYGQNYQQIYHQNYQQSAQQNKTYSLNGKIYDGDDNPLGF